MAHDPAVPVEHSPPQRELIAWLQTYQNLLQLPRYKSSDCRNHIVLTHDMRYKPRSHTIHATFAARKVRNDKATKIRTRRSLGLPEANRMVSSDFQRQFDKFGGTVKNNKRAFFHRGCRFAARYGCRGGLRVGRRDEVDACRFLLQQQFPSGVLRLREAQRPE